MRISFTAAALDGSMGAAVEVECEGDDLEVLDTVLDRGKALQPPGYMDVKVFRPSEPETLPVVEEGQKKADELEQWSLEVWARGVVKQAIDNGALRDAALKALAKELNAARIKPTKETAFVPGDWSPEFKSPAGDKLVSVFGKGHEHIPHCDGKHKIPGEGACNENNRPLSVAEVEEITGQKQGHESYCDGGHNTDLSSCLVYQNFRIPSGAPEQKQDLWCRVCLRDNRNGTHDALVTAGHLGHDFAPYAVPAGHTSPCDGQHLGGPLPSSCKDRVFEMKAIGRMAQDMRGGSDD